MKHSKKILTASIALLLGVSGLVLADHFVNEHLANEGFEGEGGEWIPTGEAARLDDSSSARTDDWSMFISADEVVGGSAEQLVEGLDECSPYGLATFELSGYYNNPILENVPDGEGIGDYASVAGMMVHFNVDGPFATSTDVFTDGYEEMTLGGNVPAWAMSATVTIDGMPHDNTHVDHTGDDTVDVHWDDMAFMTDCVADYAKVSGKAGDSSRPGKGKNALGANPRGAYSFSGALGTLESQVCDAAEPVGMLHINYKNAGFSCDFEPIPSEPIVYVDDTATLTVTYECVGDGYDGDGEDATIVLTQGEGGPNGNGNTKDRGMISVDADDVALDIEVIELDKGNVKLMQPEACI